MYAAREIVNDISDSDQRLANDVAESGARSEQLRHAREEEDSDEASDYTLEEVFEYSADEQDERFGGIQEEYSDMPVLVEDDWCDSDSDSESEFEYDDIPSDKPTVTPDNQGLWAVVDDWSDSVDESGHAEGCSTPLRPMEAVDNWSDDEFIGNEEIDDLAREMADHIIRKRNTSEVEEFLFATGDQRLLTDQKGVTVHKRAVYVLRDK
ncbi:hypothetical protein DFH07DRAFT_783932 [Mycena maculata]|uniref:Uncharacterized protein n=1 Tax=Mycena maculata TaxID=230809 RepID=A0AAD7HJG4_9AGAR|nr:hypothetical protein DFH07DRAFT_783932 [Mycena maculata]